MQFFRHFWLFLHTCVIILNACRRVFAFTRSIIRVVAGQWRYGGVIREKTACFLTTKHIRRIWGQVHAVLLWEETIKPEDDKNKRCTKCRIEQQYMAYRLYVCLWNLLSQKCRKGKHSAASSSLDVIISRSLCAFLRDLSLSISLPLCLRESEMPDDHSTLWTHSRTFRIPKSVAKIRLPRHVLGSRKGTWNTILIAKWTEIGKIMEKMSLTFVFIFLIFGQVLLQTSNGVQGKQFFGIGQRQEGDSLVLKDILSSRPAGISEPPRVAFTYNITEPITYIEFTSEEVSLSTQNPVRCTILPFGFRIFGDPRNRNKNLLFSSPQQQQTRDMHIQMYICIYLFIFSTHVCGILSVICSLYSLLRWLAA